MSEKKTFTEHRPAAPAPRRAPQPPQARPQTRSAAAAKPVEKPASTAAAKPVDEIGGPAGPDPTRYGDWEFKGRCIDF